MKKILSFLSVVLISAFVFSILSYATEIPAISSESTVYVDYNNGNNENDGSSASTAKKMISSAIELVPNGGTMVVSGKLVIGGNYTIPELGGTLLITSNDGTVNYKNFEPVKNPACAFKMGTGTTLTITSDVIIDDIILFQEASESNIIRVTNNATLYIGENVDSVGSPYSEDACYMAIEVDAGSTVIAKSGIFQSISGDGNVIVDGAYVIEGVVSSLDEAMANALYTIKVISDCNNLNQELSALDAKVLVENLTEYEASFSNDTVSEAEFLTELLSALGYSDFDDAVVFANSLGLVDHSTAYEKFTRKDAFKICVNALDVENNEGISVADLLVSGGKVSEKALGYAKRIAAGEKIIVACVGDSITEGAGSSAVAKYSYPAQLQKLLGNGFEVVNCGKSGAYVMNLESEYNVKAEDRPDLWYPATTQYTTLMSSSPDVVIVMLGTNDARSMTAMPAEDVFEEDYKKLIADIASLDSNPEIYLATMIPAVNSDLTHQGTYYTLPLLIKNIADELGLNVVDNSKALSAYYYAMLPYNDSVHPTDESYPALAVNFYNNVFGYNEPLPVLENAENNVVFLSSNGDKMNGGTSPSDAVDTLAVAISKLTENGGTVVVCGATNVSRTFFAECGGEVVITSVYDGVDYRKTNGAILNVKGVLSLSSAVTLENVTLNVPNSGQSICCGYNNFTVGEDVECIGENALTINAGYRLASGVITSETVSCHEDCTISIASGTWDYICGGNQRTNSLNQFGTVDAGVKLSIYISGGEFVHVGTLNINTMTGQSGVDGEVYMEISGGKFAGDVCGVCRPGSNDTGVTPSVSGKLTLKVTGGEFGGRIALYQNSDCPAVSGSSEFMVSKACASTISSEGFATVTVIDVLTMLGDANGDGVVNLIDGLNIVKYITDPSVDIYKTNSDYNGDESVTVYDVLCILKQLADQ